MAHVWLLLLLLLCRYVFDADVNDARTITVPRLDGFRVDVAGVRWARVSSAKIIGHCRAGSQGCLLLFLPSKSTFSCLC